MARLSDVVQDFKDSVTASSTLKTFVFGDISEFNADKNPTYPAVILSIPEGNTQKRYNPQVNHPIQLYIVDQQGKVNEQMTKQAMFDSTAKLGEQLIKEVTLDRRVALGEDIYRVLDEDITFNYTKFDLVDRVYGTLFEFTLMLDTDCDNDTYNY